MSARGTSYVVCPLHHQKVMTRGGVVAGRCWECANEAANAMQWLRAHPHPRRVPLAVVA
jgi:hypothetical protein